MTDNALHVYAVNTELDVRHTFLSRSNGTVAALPNLAGWLGLRQGGLNTDEIELFPLTDLAGMPLSSYISTAFDILDAPLGQTATRLNALDGHVLLVPSAALAGEVRTGPELTEIASLPMAQADHSADALQPAPVDRSAAPLPDPAPAAPKPRNTFWLAVLTAFILALLLFIWSNFL